MPEYYFKATIGLKWEDSGSFNPKLLTPVKMAHPIMCWLYTYIMSPLVLYLYTPHCTRMPIFDLNLRPHKNQKSNSILLCDRKELMAFMASHLHIHTHVFKHIIEKNSN